ncbi:Smr/MutS family protein [Treponema sp. HNW]|uniref:Smr/MutS family protein n=1 Tax=Treponema sp. HNW TaxID=3116654 RepID=UPI003D13E404
MDFADILAQWEKEQQNGRKKGIQVKREPGAAPVSRSEDRQDADNQKRINPMDLWMRRYGVVDKDAAFERMEEKRRYSSAASIKKLPFEAQLDLHGLTREEAWQSLDSFIGECSRRKLKKVLIVHGKGNHSAEEPVLKDTVRAFIEKDTRLGSSGHPSGAEGGRGATWVIIRASLHRS